MLMKTVHAIYENGVFRPKEKVHLPEQCEVEFEPRPVNGTAKQAAALEQVDKVLARRHDTGIRDLAARHNEHQP